MKRIRPIQRREAIENGRLRGKSTHPKVPIQVKQTARLTKNTIHIKIVGVCLLGIVQSLDMTL